MTSSRHRLLAAGALAAAGLACAQAGNGRDVAATVNAVSSAVQQTLAVQTQPPNLGPTSTPLPLQSTVTPPAIPSPLPTFTNAPPPSPTPPPPTAGELARPNGPPLHGAHRTSAPVIDGDLSDWGAPFYSMDKVVFNPSKWSGADDQSAEFGVGWDAQYLYLAARVTDDLHVQTQHGELIFKGDSLELLLDSDLAGDYASARLDDDDYQLGLSPGSLIAGTPEAYLWFPAARKGQPAGLILGARQAGHSEGYTLEAAIPWSLFGLQPAAGDRFGFVLSASDNDSADTAAQESMISSVETRRLTNPTTWGTLILDG